MTTQLDLINDLRDRIEVLEAIAPQDELADARCRFNGMRVPPAAMPPHADPLSPAQSWARLLELLGHVYDGSHTNVSLSQDDATNECIVSVGGMRRRRFGASTFARAIKLASES